MTADNDLTLKKAQRLIASHVKGGKKEVVSLLDGLDRCAFADIRSPLPVPHFRQATMDGFAVKASVLKGAGPWQLPIAGEIAAGRIDIPNQRKNEAYRIMTGGTVPDRVDQVIPQEWCKTDNGTDNLLKKPTQTWLK
ncbi:MAG: hypothetical protein BM485_00655 [Desulfobulbaceae bacterium DB1]|nr:MAG: hypothetical protein BM485_00655 [Desulfobulbaceae bacterium DB1]